MNEGQTIDREEFLKNNKLSNVLGLFIDRDIEIEELIEFDKTDLKAFAKEIGLDALSQNRLIKAITKLKPSSPNALAPSSFSTGSTNMSMSTSSKAATHVIVSPEEHEAISALYQRYEDSSKLLASLKTSFVSLEEAAKKCKIDVNEGFDSLVSSLENKKISLIEECKAVKNEKKEKLMAQLQGLKQYCLSISEGKKQYEQYIADPNMDIHKRKNAILSMIDDIINDKKISLVMVTQPKIAFNIDKKQVTKFVESLVIDDCDQPFPPLVVITKLESNRIVIVWTLDNKYLTNNTKEITMFEVSWCKMPKSYVVKDEKDIKKSKKKDKKRKKSKKKKKKKKYDLSSSEDESEDENDGDSMVEEEENENLSKPKEGDQVTRFGVKKKTEIQKKEKKKMVKKVKKSKKKKKKKDDSDSDSDSDSQSDSSSQSDSESDSDDSKSESDSDSNSDSDSDSDSDSESDSDSDSDSDTNSDSSLDSEDDQKNDRRKRKKKHKNKKKGKEKEVKFEILSDFKEADDMDWKSEQIKNKKGSKKWKFVMDDLSDNNAYALRVRGKNASGWGIWSNLFKVQTPKMLLASKLLKSKESGVLMNKILDKKLRKKRFKLLFRASKHNFSGPQFHAMCNNKGATVTIVATTTGNIFGAYTSVPWTSNNRYEIDQKAFLFLLKSNSGAKPQKFGMKMASNNVYHHGSYGPTFGSNHDLHISNACNTNQTSYTNLGGSYIAAHSNKHVLAGSRNFMVKDYEVWQLK